MAVDSPGAALHYCLNDFFCVHLIILRRLLGHLPALFGKFLLFAYFDLRGVESDSTRRLD